jgi:[ribosomal protein S18]-alanine N-acetyltransferase
MKTQTYSSHIRWMIRSDIEQVLQIENESFDFAWSEEVFIRYLRQRNCIGMVNEIENRVAGFMVYELYENRIHLVNFCVKNDFRRTGVGTEMMKKLVSKLSEQRRNRIMLEVRETNLAAQHFFKRMEFRAISVLRGFYEETDEDAYLMQYRLRSES